MHDSTDFGGYTETEIQGSMTHEQRMAMAEATFNLKRKREEKVRELNARYGTPTSSPVARTMHTHELLQKYLGMLLVNGQARLTRFDTMFESGSLPKLNLEAHFSEADFEKWCSEEETKFLEKLKAEGINLASPLAPEKSEPVDFLTKVDSIIEKDEPNAHT